MGFIKTGLGQSMGIVQPAQTQPKPEPKKESKPVQPAPQGTAR